MAEEKYTKTGGAEATLIASANMLVKFVIEGYQYVDCSTPTVTEHDWFYVGETLEAAHERPGYPFWIGAVKLWLMPKDETADAMYQKIKAAYGL